MTRSVSQDATQNANAPRRRSFTLWPRSLAGQLIAALMLALVAAQIISIIMFAFERKSITLTATRGQILDRTASVVRVLNQTDMTLHGRFLKAAEGQGIRFDLEDSTDLSVPEEGSVEAGLASRLERRAGLADNTVRFSKLPDDPFLLSQPRPDPEDDMPNMMAPPQPAPAPNGPLRNGQGKGLGQGLGTGAGQGMGPGLGMGPGMGQGMGQGLGMRNGQSMNEDDLGRRNNRVDDRRQWRRFADHSPVWTQDMKIAVPLDSGRWLIVQSEVPTPPAKWGRPFLVSLIVSAVLIILVVVLIVRKLTAPLRELESASRKLGRGEAIAPLKEEGPTEIRGTISAFNAMQERLLRFVQDRTRMLAAVSHDLRTPITTLRLRTEFIDDDEMREKLQATLEEMQAMTDAVLAFAREDASKEETRDVNLAALLSSMAEDYQELGRNVTFDGPDNLTFACRQVSLKRALTNLTENALRYAGNADLFLSATPRHIEIRICDNGPGIPAEKLEEVFTPFFRVEGSRNLETGGVGLGLSITRTIIRSHGGDVTLVNRPSGGLAATITLPRK
ncbi:ATP-binding protein [uncultured Cohaesibacter sp.]|uniref:ATP-binding protein n=1 Tax=uncultured Cohaesibacter sp. TaxID=1002546 RepID=UPI0029C6D709|nr:ATP-binding protein [uncultured Cohaesibacter sp.]